MTIGPDLRPHIRIGYVSAEGVVDTTGQYSYGYFESVPAVGDVLVLDGITGERDPMVVTGRYFIQDNSSQACWWIVTRPAIDADGWQAVLDIERDTNQVFREIAAEKSAELMEKLRRETAEKRRQSREAKAARREKK